MWSSQPDGIGCLRGCRLLGGGALCTGSLQGSAHGGFKKRVHFKCPELCAQGSDSDARLHFSELELGVGVCLEPTSTFACTGPNCWAKARRQCDRIQACVDMVEAALHPTGPRLVFWDVCSGGALCVVASCFRSIPE